MSPLPNSNPELAYQSIQTTQGDPIMMNDMKAYRSQANQSVDFKTHSDRH